MKNIEFLGVELAFNCKVTDEIRNSLSLGSLTLKKDGRSYLLGVVGSSLSEDEFTICCELEEDREELTESNYDLTEVDLLSRNLDEATLYIGCEYIEEPDSITLLIRSNGCTMVIDLKQD